MVFFIKIIVSQIGNKNLFWKQMEGVQELYPFKINIGEAVLWDIYASDGSLEHYKGILHDSQRKALLHPSEKPQGVWKYFKQYSSGKYSCSDMVTLKSGDSPNCMVLILTPLLELEGYFPAGSSSFTSNTSNTSNTGNTGNTRNKNKVVENNIPEWQKKWIEDDANASGGSRPNSAERPSGNKKEENSTLILRAWTGGRFPDDDSIIRKFSTFMLGVNLFAQERISMSHPDNFASYHSNIAKSDGINVTGGKKYHMGLQELLEEHNRTGSFDLCNVSISFKETILKKNNPEGGVWRCIFPRTYDYRTELCPGIILLFFYPD